MKSLNTRFRYIRILIFFGALMMLSACGTKKNTAMSRQWQAFNTRYNVYFNGNEHYKETLKTMEEGYEDDFTRMLLTHPADARADETMPKPKGDFKRTIEKMQKAIQLHSIKKKPAKKSGSAKEKAFRARDEFNPFLHNAWLMLGKGQYFNGDFMGAAATFMYISRHFTWLPEVVTEAMLWQARSYAALDWTYEAENILVKIKDKDLTSKNLRHLYDLVESSYLIKAGRYGEAIPFLRKAAATSSGVQKNRLYFLLGQACRQAGNDSEAYEAFRKAGSGFSTPYRLKFNARIKMSEVYRGNDISKEVSALKAMSRYQRNIDYLDQIYYAIGNLYLSRKDTADAKVNYQLAVEKSTRNGVDKAMANLALGSIYFDEREYTKAQPCYSEALPQLPQTYPDYRQVKLRSDVLDQLAVYAGNVELQDSLLAIAGLPEDKRQEWAEEQVERLKKQEKEAAEAEAREEAMANRPQGNTPIDQQGGTNGMQFNSDKSWYFYNNNTKSAGKTEFQRRWGARKLEDDWRRRNKTSFSFEDEQPEEDETGEATGEEGTGGESKKEGKEGEPDHATDPHFPEYYIAQLPLTEEQKATAADVIQEGLYNMGVILKDKLEDFPAARKEFDKLLTDYPDNVYRLDIYYNMYLMAARRDDTAGMETWRKRIIDEFPESPYGKAMEDPDYFDRLKRMHEVEQQMYADAYADYLADRNKEVHAVTQKMEAEYPLSAIMPKFVFIDALSYLTEGDYDQFKERLTELLRKWPDTDMTDVAGAMLKGINEGRRPNSGSTNTRGMIWDIRLSSSEEPLASDGQPANFERDPNSPQYLVLAYPRDEINGNLLLYDVARFNFSSFVVKDFDLEPMSFDNVGMIVIKGFSNLRELENYRRVMTNRDFQLPEGVRPIMISKHNFELLLKEGRSFEEYFRFEENAMAEEAVDAAMEGSAEVSEESENSEQSEESEISEQSENSEQSEQSEESEISEQSEESENSEQSEESEISEQSEESEISEQSEESENSEQSEISEPSED
ncbi:MAG: tetratricopeptide repeat protein [Muribaculaceae bacterium]|nr:tetratricopeptide repeat protein [Muribaculaceae bacterium]